uniref:Uncharacterized protein n=1 Tax=Panagrolaimus davidi TaxID=227884 RepID=A0A914Q175_9BILA
MAIFGYVIKKNFVSSKNKVDLRKWEYIHGSSYMSSTAVKAILEESKNHFHSNFSDIFYTGFIAEAAGITLIDAKKHFGIANLLTIPECDKSGRPFLFCISNVNDESEAKLGGFDKAFEDLKSLKCPK